MELTLSEQAKYTRMTLNEIADLKTKLIAEWEKTENEELLDIIDFLQYEYDVKEYLEV